MQQKNEDSSMIFMDFRRRKWAWLSLKPNIIWGGIIRDILTKFDSLSSYIPRDLRVHTNKYDLIYSIVNTEQEYIYFKVKQTAIY